MGAIDPAAAPVYLTYTATYNTPSALSLTGSVAGGALLIVTGSGFHIPQLLSFAGNDSFVETANYSAVGGDVVLIGGQTCVLEDVSFTMLICRVPAPTSQAAGTAAITINGAALATYTYSASATPQVTSVTPAQVSAAVTTIVTITGTGFTVPSAYPAWFYSVDTDNPYDFTAVGHAATYDNTLFSEFAVHFNALSCFVLTATATQITCQLTRNQPPNPLTSQLTFAPTVYVMGQGYAQVGQSTVEIALQVNSVSPLIGSLQGGQYVTITGAGFVSQSTLSVSIDILTNKQLSDYPSMTTQSVTTHEMHVMSLTEGTVPESQRFFPMQTEHRRVSPAKEATRHGRRHAGRRHAGHAPPLAQAGHQTVQQRQHPALPRHAGQQLRVDRPQRAVRHHVRLVWPDRVLHVLHRPPAVQLHRQRLHVHRGRGARQHQPDRLGVRHGRPEQVVPVRLRRQPTRPPSRPLHPPAAAQAQSSPSPAPG